MVNQDFNDPKKSGYTRGPRIKKRLPCTCLCCKDGVKLFVDGQRKHLCPQPGCGRLFLKKDHLMIHFRSHSGEKPYSCSVKSCGKRFSRADAFAIHRRMHSGEKIYKCYECPKSYAHLDTLKKHNVRIHASKPDELVEPEVIYIKSEPTRKENETNKIIDE